MADPTCLRIGGPSDKNPHNSPVWMAEMRTRYAGTSYSRTSEEKGAVRALGRAFRRGARGP